MSHKIPWSNRFAICHRMTAWVADSAEDHKNKPSSY
jgi:hypothetical protein